MSDMGSRFGLDPNAANQSAIAVGKEILPGVSYDYKSSKCRDQNLFLSLCKLNVHHHE